MDKNDFYYNNSPGNRTYVVLRTKFDAFDRELFKRDKSMVSRIQDHRYLVLTAEEMSSIEELEEKRRIERVFPEEEREAAYELIQALKDVFKNET